eukprot:COSAG02_NODE_2111_length_9804_cov_5.586296_4_plen_50_part_00
MILWQLLMIHSPRARGGGGSRRVATTTDELLKIFAPRAAWDGGHLLHVR